MPGRADANRRHILEVAFDELLRDQDASMDRIARAAGVVRRTVYGHFPSRDALIAALTQDAAEAIAAVNADAQRGIDDPAEALAHAVLALWRLADHYRLLITLAQRGVADEPVRRRLAAIRAGCAATLQQGLDRGVFASPLPAAALAAVHEQILFGLMVAVDEDTLPARDAAHAAAVTTLTASGVPVLRAEELVAKSE